MHVMQVPGNPGAPILFVNVTGSAISPQMQFPSESAFPVLPTFLTDILPGEVQKKREINYGTITRPTSGRNLTQWAIDGKQFEDGHVDQLIQLNTVEEWTVSNEAGPTHPFHIHVNPFQIVELFDPNSMTTPLKLSPPFVWWDTFAIPKSKTDATTGKVIKGYFKMRSRFVDFTGMYVQHCHILAHEDRGMMQLVEVCQDVNSPTCGKHTNIKHH
jgi:FtsP/CotA-like multicopper oxidase with cupredoxin domain